MDPRHGRNQAGDPHVVGDLGPVGRRRPDRGDDQSGVVALGIEIHRPAGQPRFPDQRLGKQKVSLAERPVAAHITPRGKDVVQGQPGRDFPAGHPVALEDRQDEGEGPDQVGGETEQNPTLLQRLPDQVEAALFEIAQPAVDEAARS